MPMVRPISGVLRNMARFTAMMRVKISDQPKIFALLPACTSSTVRLFSVIQALPKSAGLYQTPPSIKAEIAAARTASQFTVLMSIALILGDYRWYPESIFYFSPDELKRNEAGKKGDEGGGSLSCENH